MAIIRRRTDLVATLVGTALLATALVGCRPDTRLLWDSRGLWPTFQTSVTDYINRCRPNEPTAVTVRAPAGTTVAVAGQPPQGGNYVVNVDQEENERYTLVVTRDGVTTTHHVRCLPAGFPYWSVVRSGQPQAAFYATVLSKRPDPNTPVIFDTNGVPVWWAAPENTLLLNPMPNGNLATMVGSAGGGMVERRLDGTVVRVLNTQGAPVDFHDMLLLPNGNYALVSIERRACDLSPWGEGPAVCLFHEVQELTPAGQVVWSWPVEDDIPLSETSPTWRDQEEDDGARDPWHWNSIEWTGDGFLLSLRHMDAVYKVDYASKQVAWKLGGSLRGESLGVVGDPVFNAGGSISGQHDARLSGTTLTLFDNGSRRSRAPRSVTYQLDLATRTLFFIRQVTDPIAPTSNCCGSTRRLAGGNYVTGWGGQLWFTENQPDGTQVFRLNVGFVYRSTPIPNGVYSRDQLRAGMDAQFDGPTPASSTLGGAGGPTVPEDTGWRGDLDLRLGR